MPLRESHTQTTNATLRGSKRVLFHWSRFKYDVHKDPFRITSMPGEGSILHYRLVLMMSWLEDNVIDLKFGFWWKTSWSLKSRVALRYYICIHAAQVFALCQKRLERRFDPIEGIAQVSNPNTKSHTSRFQKCEYSFSYVFSKMLQGFRDNQEARRESTSMFHWNSHVILWIPMIYMFTLFKR